MAILNEVTSQLGTIIGWFGSVLSSVINAPANGTGGELHALLPVFAVGICVTVVFSIVGLLKRFTWGA